MVGRGRGVGLFLGVYGNSLVGNLGDITVSVVSSVGHSLCSAIRKSNGVGSSNIAGWVRCLGGVELSLGVVIGDTVLESIWGGLLFDGGVVGGSRGVVGSGSRSVVGGRCVVNDRGVVDNRSVVNDRGMVDNRCMVS